MAGLNADTNKKSVFPAAFAFMKTRSEVRGRGCCKRWWCAVCVCVCGRDEIQIEIHKEWRC